MKTLESDSANDVDAVDWDSAGVGERVLHRTSRSGKFSHCSKSAATNSTAIRNGQRILCKPLWQTTPLQLIFAFYANRCGRLHRWRKCLLNWQLIVTENEFLSILLSKEGRIPREKTQKPRLKRRNGNKARHERDGFEMIQHRNERPRKHCYPDRHSTCSLTVVYLPLRACPSFRWSLTSWLSKINVRRT